MFITVKLRAEQEQGEEKKKNLMSDLILPASDSLEAPNIHTSHPSRICSHVTMIYAQTFRFYVLVNFESSIMHHYIS